MKTDFFKPILKPGFILFALNSVLCVLFGLAAGLTMAVTWIIHALIGVLFPLLPLTVIAFTGLSVAAWVIFGKRLDLGPKERLAAAITGVSPLALIAACAFFGALTFLTIPADAGIAILGPVMVGIVACLAAIVCAACVIRIPRQEPAPA